MKIPSRVRTTPEEQSTVSVFVEASRRERYVTMLKANRRKFTLELAHFAFWDKRFQRELPYHLTANDIHALLVSKGAPEVCHVISEHSDLDGAKGNLREILQKVVGSGFGSVIICCPLVMAYFESEEGKFILDSRNK